ncbi:hypothetical protein J3Q64DRAFT_1719032 [Phycomyces blakesleeanus]|uniref:Cation efflux protein transmembrane domain-containing protein n=1 Tax=Phycomyces blakesleeanus TaxID=4837 RepID=A0ABR3BBF2_PHYBL
MSLPPTSSIIERRRSRRSIYSIASDIRPPIVDFETHRASDEKLDSIKNKKVQSFYKHQNEMIDRFLEVDHVVECLQRGEDPHETSYGAVAAVPPRDRDEEEGGSGQSEPLLGLQKNMGDKRTKMWIVHLAINLSFVANIMLFAAKLFVAFYSGSMAILASAFESFLDIVSNAIIFFTVRIIRHKDFYTYPVGKSRMEPLGIVVFAVIITTSFSQVLISSVERLADPEKVGEELDLSLSALLLLGANIGVKAILWGWCATIKGSSSVEALAYDHENDVVFSIASTIFPLVGIWANMPWLDPLGAIILSLYIIYEWMSILLGKAVNLGTNRAFFNRFDW